MQAIILASGRGSRFRPLTDFIPKPLLPLANRPLLEYLLFALTEVGCTDLFVTIGYAGDRLEQFLAVTSISSSVKPVLVPDWEQGPLASFKAVIPYLSNQEPFILVPADLYISPQNLRLLSSSPSEMALLFDAETKKAGTLIQMNASQQISKFTQSSDYLPDYFSSLPALRVTPEFLQLGLKVSSAFQSTIYDLLCRWLEQGGIIQGIPITDRVWCDVDTPRHLINLNHYLLTDGWPPMPRPPGTYVPAGTAVDGPIQSATLSLGHQSQIMGPVLVGTQVQVGNNCFIHDGTTLGPSTIIQANSELAQCITFPHTQVPSNVNLNSVILDTEGNIVHI